MSEYTDSPRFIDLVSQQNLIRSEIDTAIAKVLEHGQYIMGPEVYLFEDKLKAFTGANYAVTCANGTDAISLVLMAWDISPGSAVFVPSFTYVASAEAVAQLGAVPYFVDVCEQTFNICPDSLKTAINDCKTLGIKCEAIIAVDLFGQPANIDEIVSVAKDENLKVLVDAAQSLGASNKGRMVGTLGDATTTSFFPAKPLGCYGDGGAVFTNDDDTAAAVRSLSLHGKGENKYDHVRVGMNSRLDSIQAAILIEKLRIFPKELKQRNILADFYNHHLQNILDVPNLMPKNTSSWAQYTLKSEKRDNYVAHLKKNEIPTAIYYPKALTLQKAYAHYPKVKSGTPISEKLSGCVFSIPMHAYMNKKQAMNVVAVLKKLQNI